MKSCVIQMPRRAAAGGECLLVPTPGDVAHSMWLSGAAGLSQPQPQPQPPHTLTHTPSATASLPIHAEPCPSVLPQPELAGLTVPVLQHDKKLPLPAGLMSVPAGAPGLPGLSPG